MAGSEKYLPGSRQFPAEAVRNEARGCPQLRRGIKISSGETARERGEVALRYVRSAQAGLVMVSSLSKPSKEAVLTAVSGQFASGLGQGSGNRLDRAGPFGYVCPTPVAFQRAIEMYGATHRTVRCGASSYESSLSFFRVDPAQSGWRFGDMPLVIVRR